MASTRCGRDEARGHPSAQTGRPGVGQPAARAGRGARASPDRSWGGWRRHPSQILTKKPGEGIRGPVRPGSTRPTLHRLPTPRPFYGGAFAR